MQILVAATNTADQLWPSPAEGLASTGWNWHHAVMHRLGLGVFVGLVVCCPAACGSEPNSAPVAPGTVPPSPATTPSATTTNSVSATCIRSTGPTSVGGLRLIVGADAQCTNEGLTSVLVSNSTGAPCTSDFVATLSDGKRLLFTSESGYGGEQGRWAPLPDSVVEGTGIIEYPPGDRRWPIDLPRLLNGTRAMSLPITCEGQAITLTATFTVGSGPRLWVQPLFALGRGPGRARQGRLAVRRHERLLPPRSRWRDLPGGLAGRDDRGVIRPDRGIGRRRRDPGRPIRVGGRRLLVRGGASWHSTRLPSAVRRGRRLQHPRRRDRDRCCRLSAGRRSWRIVSDDTHPRPKMIWAPREVDHRGSGEPWRPDRLAARRRVSSRTIRQG